jgi:hypothetical protein
MSSLENKAGSLDGWLEQSSNRDRRRDLRKDDVPGPVLAPCVAGERCRMRRGGGRGTSLSILGEVVRSMQSRE